MYLCASAQRPAGVGGQWVPCSTLNFMPWREGLELNWELGWKTASPSCRLHLRSHGVADTRFGGRFNSGLCTRHFYSLAISSAPSTDERIEAAGEGVGGVATRLETSVENLHASFFWSSHLVSSAFHLTSASQVTPSLVTPFAISIGFVHSSAAGFSPGPCPSSPLVLSKNRVSGSPG